MAYFPKWWAIVWAINEIEITAAIKEEKKDKEWGEKIFLIIFWYNIINPWRITKTKGVNKSRLNEFSQSGSIFRLNEIKIEAIILEWNSYNIE